MVMAESSTLQRASNLRPEKGLASLFEGGDTSDNIEHMGWRNPMGHVLLDNIGSQTLFYHAPGRNVLLSHDRTDEVLLVESIAPASLGPADILGYQTFDARLTEPCPVRYNSRESGFQESGVTWGFALQATDPPMSHDRTDEVLLVESIAPTSLGPADILGYQTFDARLTEPCPVRYNSRESGFQGSGVTWGFALQATDPPMSHDRTDEVLLVESIAPAYAGPAGILWNQISSAQRLVERSPAEGSNYWPVWYNSRDSGIQGGRVTWESALQAAEPRSTDLVEALKDLDDAIEEAEEQGYLKPSHIALSNGRSLVRKLYRIAPRRFEVYPTPDAEIAIDAPGEGSSFVVLCDSRGGALCMANLPDGHRTKYYSTTDILPDSFVSEALARLVR